MFRKIMKRCGILGMLCALLGGMPGAAGAEIQPIPLDMKEHGTTPKAEGWLTPNAEYQDESIHATLYEKKKHKAKSSDGPTTIHWVVIEVSDPSQIRTVLSYDSYEDKNSAEAPEMVRYLNPVVALNDDYVKMSNYKGYVMRQGVFCNDNLDEWGEDLKQDVLIIDDQGDFSVVQKASSADVESFVGDLDAQGKKPVNIFTFGPALVLNGEAQTILRSDSTHAVNISAARTAICQLDHLKYAVFAVDGVTGVGMNCQELANFIVQQFPECRVAYNLDGGGSSRLFMGTKKVNSAKGRREIYGMIYFASAAAEE